MYKCTQKSMLVNPTLRKSENVKQKLSH